MRHKALEIDTAKHRATHFGELVEEVAEGERAHAMSGSGWLVLGGLSGLTSLLRCATIVSMSTEPLRSVRDHLSEFVDRVEREHDRVMITRNGRDAAVLISAEDLAELEETLSVLSDPEALVFLTASLSG